MSTSRSSRSLGRVLLVAIGIALGLAVVEAGMRATGAVVRRAQAQRNQETLRRQHRIRIVCLGESTTAGDAENGRYPEMLEAILNRQDLGGRVAVANLGLSGAVTFDLVGDFRDSLAGLRPDVVVAMMGINDAGRTHSYGSIIAPGAGRWYGSFRLYKLFRVLRHAAARWWNAEAVGASLVLGDGIAQSRDPVDAAAVAAWNDQHPRSAPRDRRTLRTLDDLRARLERRDFAGVESALRAVIEAEPHFADPYVLLAAYYRESGRAEEAHRALLRGAQSATGLSAGLHAALARSHYLRGDHDPAFAALRRVIEEMIEPGNFGDRTHFMLALADLYEQAGRYPEAERTLRDVVERVNPGNDVIYEHLIQYYERRDAPAAAARSREQQRRIRYEYVNPITRDNYLILRRGLAARGIPLVAVQYPGRDVASLRRLLDDDAGVIYVDNSAFRQRIAADGYARYFYDRFAGDFGHLTRAGNCLLARNVARAIVERFLGLAFDPSRAACDPAAPSLTAAPASG